MIAFKVCENQKMLQTSQGLQLPHMSNSKILKIKKAKEQI